MTNKILNGSNRTLLGVLVALVVLGIASALGYTISETKSVHKALEVHKGIDGHATIMERSKTLARDIGEIKASLRRIEDKLP